ncbi:MAG: T9SS type A sorting domain-containing protein, partial [Bacteroidota bacterium]
PDNPMAPGYGTRPPAQAVVFLSGPKVDADGQDNAVGVGPGASINGVGFGDGIVDNERYGMTHYMHYFNNIAPTVTEPVQGPNYYNYMRGIWLDGSPWVYGGNGYNPGDPNAVRARYHFPGDTDPLGFGTDGVPQLVWNETTSGNTPFDRRGHVGSAGPFTFSAGARQEVDLAFVFARAESGGAAASVALMQDYIDRVREDFTTPWIRCGGFALSTEPEPQPATVSVYPNPATDQFTATWQGLNGPAHYRVTDMAGRLQASGILHQQRLKLDVGAWPAGVYVLHLDSPAGSLTAKLIKQ